MYAVNSSNTIEPVERKRSGCLTALIIVIMISSVLSALSYIFLGSMISDTYLDMDGWAVPALIVISIADLIFAFGTWNWKKWGVIGYGISTLVTFFINIIVVGYLPAVIGLLGFIILLFLIRPKWKYLE